METPCTLHINADEVYEPAEDTFLLMDAIEMDLPWLRDRTPALCVEIGSGSGVVASAVSQVLNVACLTSDINLVACHATRETAKKHGVLGHLDSVCCNLLEAMLPRLQNAVDVLIFNPPYVPTETCEMGRSMLGYAWAGGLNGREVIDKLLLHVSDLLSQNGVFYLVLVKENNPDDVEAVLSRQGLKTVQMLSRRAGKEYLTILKACRSLVPKES